MNKFFIGCLIASVLLSCDIRKNNKQVDAVANKETEQIFNDSTTVQMIDSVYNFGKVADGEKVEYNFRFKNTGKNSLIVSKASASCGCTVPEKPDAPVKPGETGFIKVVFNSQGRVGNVHKEVYVTSNSYPKFPILQLNGEVTPKK